jgi:hypothetical protein
MMPRASRKVRLVLLELVASPDATSREAADEVARLYPLDETGRQRAELARSRGLLAERVEALAVRLATALGDVTLAGELAEAIRLRAMARSQRAPVSVLGVRPRPAPIVTPERIAADVERILGPDPNDGGSS